MVGTTMATNYGGWPRVGNRVPAGRLLVLDDSCVYGFGRDQYIHHGAHVGIDGATIFHFRPERDDQRRFTQYQAFAISRQSPGAAQQPAKAGAKRRRAPAAPSKKYRWTQKLPILVRALVLAQNTLFLAGPPDILATDDSATALEGKKGGLLYAFSAADGNKLAQYELDSPPVFDGMAAVKGHLYLATTDGKVLCFSGNN
jgi:hypothetical protein